MHHASLEQLGQAGDREWYCLTSAKPNPQRLTLWNAGRAPKYESQACPNYLRGTIFAISGRGRSCHFDFSSTGAALMATHLKAATERAREFVDLVVPNRRELNLVEFIADADLEATAEQESLGSAGELLLAEILPREDFADWEQPK